LSSDTHVSHPALNCFEVGDVLPFEVRRLAAHFREAKIGTLEIKKRGVDLDPAQLRRQLKLRGDQAATLIITPHNGKQIAVVAHRVAIAETLVAECASLSLVP
jgi:hypothetical protein